MMEIRKTSIFGLCTILVAVFLISSVLVIFQDDTDAADVDITYTYNDGTLALSAASAGTMRDYVPGEAPWYEYAATCTSVSMGANIQSIGSYAFYGFTALETFQVPSTVTAIGTGAFARSGVSSFTSSSASFTAEDGVLYDSTHTIIVQYPVGSSESSFNIGLNITGVRGAAFAGALNLTSLTVTPGNTSFISENNVLFNGNRSTIIASLPASLTGAFSIPSSVSTILPFAFSDASALTSVDIKYNVHEIGDFAFYGTGLSTLYIPADTSSIGLAITAGSPQMTSIEVDSNNIKYASDEGVLLQKVSSTNKYILQYPTSKIGQTAHVYTIPDNVTKIQPYAFYKTTFTDILFTESLTEIGTHAFDSCALTNFYTPDTVTTIGTFAFYNCTALKSVGLSGKLSELKTGTFLGCDNMNAILMSFNMIAPYDYGPSYGAVIREHSLPSDKSFYHVSWSGETPSSSASASVPTDRLVYGDLYETSKSISSILGKNNLTGMWCAFPSGTSGSGQTCVIMSKSSAQSIGSKSNGGLYSILLLQGGPGFIKDGENVSNKGGVVSVAEPIGGNRQLGWSYGYSVQLPLCLQSLPFISMYGGAIEALYLGTGVVYGQWFMQCPLVYLQASPGSSYSVIDAVLYDSDGNIAQVGSSSVSIVQDDSQNAPLSQSLRLPSSADNLRFMQVSQSAERLEHATLWTESVISFVIPESVTSLNFQIMNGRSNLAFLEIGSSAERIQIKENESAVYYKDYQSFPGFPNLVIVDATYGTGGNENQPLKTGVIIDPTKQPGEEGYSENTKGTILTSTNQYYEWEAYKAAIKDETDLPTPVTSPNLLRGHTYISTDSTLRSRVTYDYIADTGLEYILIESNVDKDVDEKMDVVLVIRICDRGKILSVPENLSAILADKGIDIQSITNVVLQHGVTGIGQEAFSGFSKMVGIVIPTSVTSIGANAFQNCSSLLNINIPENVTSIGGFDDDVGNDAFLGCTSLKNIYVSSVRKPTSSDMPGNATFKGSDGVLFSKDGSVLIKYPTARQGPYTIPDDTESIEDYAFASSLISSINLSNIEDLGEYAFTGSHLTAFSTPSGLSTIPAHSFQSCEYLGSINIGADVSQIDDYAFDGCTALSSISFNNDESITYGSFAITLSKGSTSSYTWYDFADEDNPVSFSTGNYGALLTGHTYYKNYDNTYYPAGLNLNYKLIEGESTLTLIFKGTGTMYDFQSEKAPWYDRHASITAITMQTGITSIGDYAFQDLTSVDNLTLPSTIVDADALGVHCFDGMTSLSSISNLQPTVTILPDGFMQGCIGLHSFTIAGAVKKIGSDAFKGCEGLTEIIYTGTTEPAQLITIGTDAFATGASTLTVVSDFQQPSKEWSPFATKPSATADVTMIYAAHSTSGTVDLRWHVEDVSTRKNAKLVFDGTATETGDFTLATVPWKAFSGTIDTIALDSDINTIGTFAFAGCTALESITLPSTFTVKQHSFEGSGLTSVVIQSASTVLETDAFKNVTALKNVTMPVSMILTADVFNGCTSISTVSLTGTTCGDYSSSVTANQYQPWMKTTSDLTVILEPGLTSISENMFYECIYLKKIDLTQVKNDAGIGTIGSKAFYQCTGLQELSIGSKSTTIASDAFYDLTGLKTLTMPLDFTDDPLFSGDSCRSLSHVILTGTSCPDYTRVEGEPVTGTYLNTPWHKVTDTSTNIVVTFDQIDKIGDYMFYDCDRLLIISVPSSVASIGEYAFYDCDNLAAINLLMSESTYLTNIGTLALETTRYDDTPLDNFSGTTLCCRFSDLGSKTEQDAWIATLYSGGKATSSETTFLYEDGVPYKQCGDSMYVKWVHGESTIYFLGSGEMWEFTDLNDTGDGKYVRPWQVGFVFDDDSYIVTANDMAKITSVSFCEGITGIAKKAFINLGGLTEATMPSTVRTVGEKAFYGCSLSGYQDMSKVTAVEANAFEGNSGLDWILLPYDADVKTDAFKDCLGVILYATGTQGASPAPTNVTYADEVKDMKVIMLTNVEADFFQSNGVACVTGTGWSTGGELATTFASGKVYVAADPTSYESDDNVYTASTSSTISFS